MLVLLYDKIFVDINRSRSPDVEVYGKNNNNKLFVVERGQFECYCFKINLFARNGHVLFKGFI